jgi:hypothetical protein
MWRQKPQRPPPTYENVRLVAEVLSRINVDLIERHFGVSPDTASEFMERLVAEKCFGELSADGWHYPPLRKLRVQRSSTKPKTINRLKKNDLALRVAELEREGYALRARVRRLQDAGKTVINQREQWKSRALAAKELLEAELNRRSKNDDRFDALRRLVAKELHPDFCNGGHLEKLLRQECFKKLWPEIERLADQG